jgi:glutamyl/glutaminyl-tRNA synthetase
MSIEELLNYDFVYSIKRPNGKIGKIIIEPCIFSEIKSIFEKIEWNKQIIKETIEGFAKYWGFSIKEVCVNIMVAISNSDVGPSLYESLEFLGKEKALKRISNFMDFIKSKE